jgi:hypothetical protein
MREVQAIPFVFNDGGRAASGFKGEAGDCVTRAISIATGIPYQEVYDALNALGKSEHPKLRHTRESYRARDSFVPSPAARRDRRLYRREYRAYVRPHMAHDRITSARSGAFTESYKPYLLKLGWVWTPTMKVGSGCKVHLRADELPRGRLIVKVSRHLVAVIDGVIHDTHDCSRNGTRCVYGYYRVVP